MTKHLQIRLLVLLIVGCALPWPVHGQAPQQLSDAQVYAHYRQWVSGKATATRTEATAQQPEVMAAYRKALADEGVAPAEIDRRVRVITENGKRLEIDSWNRILTSSKPMFNVEPNAFLMRVTKSVRPGTALDYGMGQGRNAIYLAQQGWTVTGFDPAEQAVAVAQQHARELGVQLKALAVGDDQFEFGKQQWDLIVLSYVGFRGSMPRIYESLKPGGLVVVEAFHRDTLKNSSVGAGVVFDSNELLKLFERFRVIQYEDAEDKTDFGQRMNRVVRLVAQKQ
jgi:2-polyprenyl-3-methyl-5-hydroxy-6-metoxy-1,4-benzoquinol methylase